jgi:hypothetical protein
MQDNKIENRATVASQIAVSRIFRRTDDRAHPAVNCPLLSRLMEILFGYVFNNIAICTAGCQPQLVLYTSLHEI